MFKQDKITIFILTLAFFFSGASALIYQVLWVKQLTLTFGSTTLAVSTILACFMAGLALGSYIMSHKAVRFSRVILTYGIIEILIGAYALILPFMFALTDNIYRYLWPLVNGEYISISIIRFLLVLSVLIIPTTLMGATLPLLVKYYIKDEENPVKYISILYGVNTFGAVIGAMVCGFMLLETFGQTGTNYIAISLNITAAIIAILLDRIVVIEKSQIFNNEPLIKKTLNYKLKDNLVLWIMLFSGFTAMIYEVVWSRQLVLIFASTPYAYTSMLTVFLVGISAGSLFVQNRFTEGNKNIYYFAIFQALIAILVISGTFYYTDLFNLFIIYSILFGTKYFIIPLLFVSILLIGPASFMFGATFPLAVKLFEPESSSISERTGLVYSYNTAGCITGSFLSGFILIPLIGLKWSLVSGTSINLILAATFIVLNLQKQQIKIYAIALCLSGLLVFTLMPAEWNKQFMTIGNFANKVNILIKDLRILDDSALVYYKEGQHQTVSVRRSKRLGSQKYDYALYNNGKVDASTHIADVRTQLAIGYVPLLLSEKLNNVLIVGMGSGMTGSVVLKFPVKFVELVELEEAIIEASKFFDERYGSPLDDSRFKVIIDDARNYLRVTAKKYDVIISEPSNVWVSGVSSLFTQDYYRIIRNKLTPGGILCQWIPTYIIRKERIISVLKALKKEFKFVYVCQTKTGVDFLLIATNEPLKMNLNNIEERLNKYKILDDMKAVLNIDNSFQFLNIFLGNNDNLERVINNSYKKVPANSDNNSYLEFMSNKDFFEDPDDFETFDTVSGFYLFKGITDKDVESSESDFYKTLTLEIINQLDFAQTPPVRTEIIELQTYKAQILTYAIRYFKTSSNVKSKKKLLLKAFLKAEGFSNIYNNIKSFLSASTGSIKKPILKLTEILMSNKRLK